METFEATLIVCVFLAVGVFFLTLVNTEAALVLLIYSMLLSPEIKLIQLPERAVVVRFDDLLVGVIFFSWLAKLAINKEVGVFRNTPINVPLGMFLVACCLSTGWGVINGSLMSPKDSFFYILKFAEYFLVFFLVANVIRDQRQLKRFLKAICLTAVLVSLYCYADLLIHTGGLFAYYRVSAPFDYNPDGQGEPNTLAAYLMLISAVCAGVALHTPSRSQRFWCLGLILLISIPLISTYSRGGYLAFLTMYMALLVLTRRHKMPLLILLLVGILVAPFGLPQTVYDRIFSTFRHAAGTIQIAGWEIPLAHSPYHRLWVWKFAVDLLMEHPFLGHGLTGVGLIDSQYPRFLGELGLVGFSAFLWMIWSVWKVARRAYRTLDDPLAQGLSLGFSAALVALMVQSLTGNFFVIVRVMEPFWCLAAMVAVLPHIFSAPPELPTPIQPRPLVRPLVA